MRRPPAAANAPIDPFALLRDLAAPRGPEPEGREGPPSAGAPERPAISPAQLVDRLRAWLRDPASGERLDALVDALRWVHLRRADPEGTDREGALYDTARRHFHRNEKQLRSQARFSEKLLDRIQADARRREQASPFQLEVRLRAAAGGRASGRFVLASELPRAARVEFRAGALRGCTLAWSDAVPVRFEPPNPTLHAGQECVVRVEVDLAGCPARPGDRLELCVDVLGDGEALLKLWLDVSIDAPAVDAP